MPPVEPTRSHDFVVPYEVYDQDVADDEDTEQHKARRGTALRLRSITHYRHATTKWGAALESFTPMWFAICISTGGFGIILNAPFPYPARWQVTCASILYVFELVLFVIFMVLMLARWIIYPHVAVRRALSSPDELGAYAIAPIALLTLAALTASQVSDARWGGHAFTIVAYVMWWTGMIWVFLTAVVVMITLFYTGNQADRSMSPTIFMAPVGLATAASEAGFISIYGSHMSARMAVPQVIVGYFNVGVAMFMAILLYTIYFHRLLASGWAPVSKRSGLFILIGPCGQISTALQLLGESVNQYGRFALYKPSSTAPPTETFWTSSTASGIDGAGLLVALLILGFGYFWLCIACVGIADVFINHWRQSRYTLNWWAVVFPSVTLTTAWLELSRAMDSPAFRVLTCIMTVLIAIGFFANLAFTVRGILNGSLLFGPTQAEMERKLMDEAKVKTEAQQV